MDKLLSEIKEVKKDVSSIMSTHDENENLIIKMLSNIESRLYCIEEDLKFIKNGGKHFSDAKGHSGIPWV